MELLPCPFCGNAAQSSTLTDNDDVVISVGCDNCEVSMKEFILDYSYAQSVAYEYGHRGRWDNISFDRQTRYRDIANKRNTQKLQYGFRDLYERWNTRAK